MYGLIYLYVYIYVYRAIFDMTNWLWSVYLRRIQVPHKVRIEFSSNRLGGGLRKCLHHPTLMSRVLFPRQLESHQQPWWDVAFSCFLDIILRYSFWGIRFRSIDQPFRCSGDSNHPEAARVTWLNDNETLALRFVRPETLPRRRARWSKGLRTHIFLFLHGRFNGRFNGRFDGDQYQTMFILDG